MADGAGYAVLDSGEDSDNALPGSLKSFGRDYRMYLEDDVDAVGWLLIRDESKLASFSRLERFWVGMYSLAVSLAIGTCLGSLHACHNQGNIESTEASWSHAVQDRPSDKIIFAFAASSISFAYEFVFLIPLMRYILQRPAEDSGIFSRAGCSGPCCHFFIFVPTAMLLILSCGFLTASQQPPPECQYTLFTGPLNVRALLYGLFMFLCSALLWGYLQRLCWQCVSNSREPVSVSATLHVLEAAIPRAGADPDKTPREGRGMHPTARVALVVLGACLYFATILGLLALVLTGGSNVTVGNVFHMAATPLDAASAAVGLGHGVPHQGTSF